MEPITWRTIVFILAAYPLILVTEVFRWTEIASGAAHRWLFARGKSLSQWVKKDTP
jgi:hypothetical protein